MVILILVLAFVLRLINLNQSLWLDEAVQAITSAGPLSGILPELIGDFHPPLYHIFMWAWVHIFGNSEIVMRLPSVLFGVGTVFFGYKIALVISNPASPAKRGEQLSVTSSKKSLITNYQLPVTTLLFATSPYLIYYSQEARMYSASVFLATLSSYLFISLLKKLEIINSKINPPASDKKSKLSPPRRDPAVAGQFKVQNYIPYFLVNVALVYTDYYGWLTILAQGLFLFIYTRRIKLGLLTVILLLVSYLPWMNMLITQMKAGLQATQALPVWASLVNLSAFKAIPLTFVKFTIGRISFPDKHFYLLVVLVIIGIYLLLVVFGVKGWLKNRRNPSARYINILIYYTFLWLLVPLIIAWLVSFKVPNFQPFRLLLILPAFHLLTVYLISNVRQIRVRWLLFIIVIAINLGGYTYFQVTPSMHREDWRGLTRYTDSQNGTLLVPSESSVWPVWYYTNSGTQLVYGAIGAEQVSQSPVVGGNTVYYLRYLVPVFDPGDKLLKQLETLGYSKIDAINYNQLEIWKYQLTK